MKYFIRFTISILFLAAFVVSNVGAADPTTKKECDEVFYRLNDIGYYNPCEAICSPDIGGGITTALVGDTPELQTWNFLLGKGLTKEQAAGVMGNISHESGFAPEAIEGSGGGGFGIVQWTDGRRTAIEQAASAAGRPATDLAFQLDYLYAELNARPADEFANEWEGLTKQSTVDDALVFFHNEFEVSFLMDFSEPGYTTGYNDYRPWPDVRSAVIGERGGYATPDGMDPNGARGAQYFFKNFAGGSGSDSASCASNATGAVHPIADGTVVTEGYGGPRSFGSVTCNNMTWHNGYDLAGKENVTPVLAAMGGVVSGPSGVNNAVNIKSPDGFTIHYLHMNSGQILVKDGDQVTTGQKIGTVGNTGYSTGAHLHFEVDVRGNTNPEVAKLPVVPCAGGEYVNPATFMKLFNVEMCPSGSCDNPVTS